jgi:hypothetical protein
MWMQGEPGGVMLTDGGLGARCESLDESLEVDRSRSSFDESCHVVVSDVDSGMCPDCAMANMVYENLLLCEWAFVRT